MAVEDHRHPRFRAAEAGRSIDELKISDLTDGDVAAAGAAQAAAADVRGIAGPTQASVVKASPRR